MGLFHFNKSPKSEFGTFSLETLHREQCKVCPLKQEWPKLHNPHMEPTGTRKPLVYMLGEGPGKTEDEEGVQFVGKAGEVLQFWLPDGWERDLRWNNCVRTRPPGNRDPHPIEVECCRPSIVKDIEATKPEAIFGFGNVPLQWALHNTLDQGISVWSGRRIPIMVGAHACWFYPMFHPSYVLRKRRVFKDGTVFVPRNRNEYGSDVEFSFKLDLERALREVEDELPDPIIHTKEQAYEDIEIVDGTKPGDLERVFDFLKRAAKRPYAGFDFETKGLRPYREDAVVLSCAVSTSEGTMAFAVSHPGAGWTNSQLDELNEAIRWFLQQPNVRKIAHNAAFEMEWAAMFYDRECLWDTEWEDTQAQAFILDERKGGMSLGFLCVQYFGIHLKLLSNYDRDNLARIPVEEVLMYNAMDAKYHYKIYFPQKARLKAEGLMPAYEHHMLRVPSCVLTQIKGIPVDQEIAARFEKKYEAELRRTWDEIRKIPIVKKFEEVKQKPFNPLSGKHLYWVMDQLGIHVESLDETVLSGIDHEIAAKVLEYRGFNKLLSTYIAPIREGSEHLYPDGLAHPILSTMKTRTWRTSSEHPNSQNFPKRENREIRSQIKPKAGEVVVAFDYAGIQARNVAMESRDKVLVDAFWDRYDIHKDWMERILKAVPTWIPKSDFKNEKAMKNWRDKAKNGLVFPSFFGAQPKKIATVLKIPEDVAKDLHAEFWDMFPDIKGWHEQLIANYFKLGYAAGLSGFRRRAPIERNELINAPIQADESVIVMTAFAELSSMNDMRYQPNMEIHDDLTFIMPKAEVEKRAEVIIDKMLGVAKQFPWINVPIGVEMSIGLDWSSTKKLEGGSEYYSDEWFGEKRGTTKRPDPHTGSWADGENWIAMHEEL